MTVKELKKEFDYVSKYNNQFNVYSEGGKRSVYKYLATVNKKGKSMFVSGYKPTTKMETLKEQINDFVSKLPYDSEYYDPRLRKGLKEELIVIDYLSSINFERNFYVNNHDGFELKTPSIYGYQVTKIALYFIGFYDENSDEIKINLSTSDYSWVSVRCKKDATEIIKRIDSLLKPLLVTEAVSNIKISDKLKMSDIELKLKELKGLNIQETDMKEYLKKELLTIANSL